MIDLDLAAFFDVDGGFAVTATYIPAVGGAPTNIPVIFDNEYAAAEYDRLADRASLESTSPRVVCRDADVPGISHGATLAISGTTYYVIEVRPDGTGVTTLVLSKDPV
ncbi:MAG: hypothetical protein WC899_10685 [bacterium]